MVSQVPCLELLHFHLYTIEGYCMLSSSLTANNTALYLQKQHSTTRGSSTSHDRALSLHHSSKNILIFTHLGSRVGILSCILQPHTGTKSPQPNSSCLPGNPSRPVDQPAAKPTKTLSALGFRTKNLDVLYLLTLSNTAQALHEGLLTHR